MSLDASTAAIYTDFQDFSRLRQGARAESPETLREVARHFEALFIQMMLKNMRSASFGDELFDSDQSKHYRDMFDSQLSVHLGQQGSFGLADLLVRQLGGESGLVNHGKPGQTPLKTAGLSEVASQRALRAAPETLQQPQPPPPRAGFESPEEFVRILRPHAVEAAEHLGIDPEVLLAQAALETGWGRKMILRPDGSLSHNLFGIKADQRWSGDRVTATTLEYEDGIAVRRQESFRAYESFSASFSDYVGFLQSSPRYEAALSHGGDRRRFVEGLQQSGYATDPDYAAKINSIVTNELLLGPA